MNSISTFNLDTVRLREETELSKPEFILIPYQHRILLDEPFLVPLPSLKHKIVLANLVILFKLMGGRPHFVEMVILLIPLVIIKSQSGCSTCFGHSLVSA